jgi:hypothetical protein
VGARRSILEESFGEAAKVVVAFAGCGCGEGDPGFPVTLLEGLVEALGEDVLLEDLQGDQALQVSVEVEGVTGAAQSDVAQATD